ncbi:MAG TPA: ABC transporter permease [Gemmatimonadaceae bacterium]|nr:ABC transporter permease [Gemmatimonadaceae bacterium]
MPQSIRVAVRELRRTPGFAVATILILALGIGLSVAVFTVAEALLIKRLPVKDQDRLVALWGQMRNGSFDHYPIGLDESRDFARRTDRPEQVAFVGYEGAWPITLRAGDETFRLRRALVSGSFFDVLGVRPVLGRALRPSDDVSGAAPVLVLSYAAWQQRFGGDPAVLGRRLLAFDNAVTYTVVGVMPRGLDYPRATEIWLPIMSTVPASSLEYVAVDVVERLVPNVTPAMAGAELSAFFLRRGGPVIERDLRGVVETLPRLVLGDTRPALLAFSAAVALLLLITCINVANLLLVRGLTRAREIAVRSALGASRLRIAGQLLTENALLALAGGVLGVIVSTVAVRLFLAFAPAGLPRIDEIGGSSVLLGVALTITGSAMLLFGLAPAVTSSRTELQEVLRSGARQSGTRRSRRATEALVVGQLTLALMMLSGAGVIAKSLIKLERANLALEPSHLLIAELALRYDQFGTRAKSLALLDRLLPKLEAIPGVCAVSPVVAIPFSGNGGWDGGMIADGQTPREIAANPMLNMEVATPGYYAALGIPVLRGRAFTDADREGTQPVVLLSQSAARHYWPNEDPIGKRLKFADTSSQWLTIIGIVPDTRYRELRLARPSIYFPLRQSIFPYVPTNLAIRTSGAPDGVIATIRRVVAESEPGVTVSSASSFDDHLDKPLAQPRLNALLLGVFAASAVVLAAVGLFSVMVTMVRQRTRELGVRMALGATPAEVWRLVLRRGMLLAAAGTLFGLVGALVTNYLLAGLLYDVTPTDVPTLSIVAITLLAMGALASLFPARSSSSIDPAVALRAE